MKNTRFDNVLQAEVSPPVVQSKMAPHMATVVGQVEGWYFLTGINGCDRAKQATSCLIQAEIGDDVLVYCSANSGTAYIVSVLNRGKNDKVTLSLPGGVALKTQSGSLNIDAKALNLTGGVAVSITTAKFNLTAHDSEVKIMSLKSWLNTIDVQAKHAIFAFKNLTTTAVRLLQRVRESFRWIDEVDETRAGRVRTQVDGAYQLQSRHCTLQAEAVVKIDGEKIDIG